MCMFDFLQQMQERNYIETKRQRQTKASKKNQYEFESKMIAFLFFTRTLLTGIWLTDTSKFNLNKQKIHLNGKDAYGNTAVQFN